MRVVVVGESPARGFESCTPIIGTNEKGKRCQTGNRFVQWCERAHLRDWKSWQYFNVYPSGLPHEVLVQPLTLYIALGKKAEQYLTSIPVPYLIVLPHPSGRNRKLNEKRYVNVMTYHFSLNFHTYVEVFQRLEYLYDNQPIGIKLNE